MTQVVVHDTITLLKPLFLSRARPKEKLAEALPVTSGLHKRIPAMARVETLANDIAAVARLDAYGALAGYQFWGLFNPTRKVEASAWAFDQLAAYDVLGRVEAYLTHTCAQFPPHQVPERLDCLVLPGDPANRELMVYGHGLAAVGAPGVILLILWPSPSNLQRLESTLARALVQSLRWQNVPPDPSPTLADYLVLEGLAASFVAQQLPTLPEPWLAPFRPPADWPDALAHVARIYGLNHYDELTGNLYGSRITGETVNSQRYPKAQPLSADEFDYAQELVRGALTAADAPTIAAYLYGDEAVANQGYAAVGLPNFAGFEVAYRWLQAYLQSHGGSIPDALGLPSLTLLGEDNPYAEHRAELQAQPGPKDRERIC
jgi:uncharacterized protein YjaZ